ncbi:hypothetical protein F5Y16DRAFT_78291 [Xylariaceae sp. FL0255]|nr:hypothetical protein F5Y16DRAFT_78291 [Xylariaceae sp. FL0255]
MSSKACHFAVVILFPLELHTAPLSSIPCDDWANAHLGTISPKTPNAMRCKCQSMFVFRKHLVGPESLALLVPVVSFVPCP